LHPQDACNDKIPVLHHVVWQCNDFFGGPGEAAHTVFVKASGQKTQRRISEFAVQTATQYSDMMVTKHALKIINCEESKLFHRGDQCVAMAQNKIQPGIDDNNLSVCLCGKYMLNTFRLDESPTTTTLPPPVPRST
jgi:hypothetical protein